MMAATMSILPPTSQLPSIRQLASYPLKDLSDAVEYLKRIYNPEVRGSRRYRSVNEASTSQHACRLDISTLQSDDFERSYAIKWLTVLISQIESWDVEDIETRAVQDKESLIQNAASLLAICSGTAAAGVIVRDFVFIVQYLTTSRKLSIHLKDVALDNGDYRSVGAQTWGGACVLADAIANDPKRYGLLCNLVRKDLRILELGAGTGLVSLTVGKLVEHAPVLEAPAVDIIATDYYPSVLANLDSNIQSNFTTSSSSPQGGNAIRISSHSLDWSSFPTISPPPSFPFHEPFDLVLGADIIYEVQHASWIKSCLERLLRKPTRSNDSRPGSTFHLVIPLRSTHSIESNTVENVFPKSEGFPHHEAEDLELGILDKETIVCEPGDGLRTDQIEYAYYVIGWC